MSNRPYNLSLTADEFTLCMEALTGGMGRMKVSRPAGSSSSKGQQGICSWPMATGRPCPNPALPDSNGRCGIHRNKTATAPVAKRGSAFQSHSYSHQSEQLVQCSACLVSGKNIGMRCINPAVVNGRCKVHNR